MGLSMGMVHDTIEAKLAVRRRLPEPTRRRELREALGLTQHDLAAELGVDTRTVGRWETDRCAPRGKHLHAYVALLERLERERAA